MGLFDRFKKKAPEPASEWPKPPKEDTMALLLMDRVLVDNEAAVEFLRRAIGPEAVVNVSYSHPHVEPVLPVVTVVMDGLEFWCSYMPIRVPADEVNVPTLAQYNLFLKPEEQEAFVNNKSFWMLAQKGGGTSLEQKRRVCWTFSLLCAALLEQEGAVGVAVVNSHLLVSKENYLTHRRNMEGKTWDSEYFPVPLWVWLCRATNEEKPTVETWGLAEFGLLELAFFDPELPIQDILSYLYTMSCLQITGQQLYRNMALIPLTPEVEVVCKQDGEKLYFIGA